MLDTNGVHRLYACKDFQVGEAITFVSELEENTGSMVLGGTCARIVGDSTESNSYLAANRTLRCTTPIAKGGEITRVAVDKGSDKYFERIDRVVVSTEKMVIGWITGQEMNEGIVVNYADGSTEVCDLESDICFAYRSK